MNSTSDPWPKSEGFNYFMHCMSVISISLTVFASYCIIYKSMNEAKFFSKLQLIHLICATTSDLFLTSLCTPVIFVPYFAGYMNGIFSKFGIEPILQVTFCLYALIGVASSILHLLWFKTFVVMPTGHWLKKEKFFKKGLLVMYPVWTIFSGYCYIWMMNEKEDQWNGSLDRMTGNWPSQIADPEQIHSVFLLARKQQSKSFIFINISIVAYIILCATAFIWARYIIKNLAVSSKKTAKLQKKAVNALTLQVSMFFILVCIPMVFFYFTKTITDKPIPVFFSHCGIFMFFLASIADTSTMIALNEGYRNTFLESTRLNRLIKPKVVAVAAASHHAASSVAPSDMGESAIIRK